MTDIGSGPRNGTCRTIHGIYASVPGVVIETTSPPARSAMASRATTMRLP